MSEMSATSTFRATSLIPNPPFSEFPKDVVDLIAEYCAFLWRDTEVAKPELIRGWCSNCANGIKVLEGMGAAQYVRDPVAWAKQYGYDPFGCLHYLEDRTYCGGR